MPNNKISQKILNLNTSWKRTTPWANAVKKEMAGASEAMVQERNKSKTLVRKVKDLLKKIRKRTGAKWSEERIDTFSAKMKEY